MFQHSHLRNISACSSHSRASTNAATTSFSTTVTTQVPQCKDLFDQSQGKQADPPQPSQPFVASTPHPQGKPFAESAPEGKQPQDVQVQAQPTAQVQEPASPAMPSTTPAQPTVPPAPPEPQVTSPPQSEPTTQPVAQPPPQLEPEIGRPAGAKEGEFLSGGDVTPVEHVPVVELREPGELPTEVEGWIERAEHDDVEEMKPIKVDGQTVVSSATPQNVKVTLPLEKSEIKQGLQYKVADSVRWLAQWCIRLVDKYKGQVGYKQPQPKDMPTPAVNHEERSTQQQ